jgi:hypothetical protein
MDALSLRLHRVHGPHRTLSPAVGISRTAERYSQLVGHRRGLLRLDSRFAARLHERHCILRIRIARPLLALLESGGQPRNARLCSH